MQQIGAPVNLSELNNTAAEVAVALRSGMDSADRLRVWLNAATDLDLENLGLVDPDARYLLRAAVQDMGLLADIWRGAAATPAHDFRTYIGRLTGVR